MSADTLHHVWTLDEYLELPHVDGFRYELFDGMVLVTPQPSVDHQDVGTQLLVALSGSAPQHLRPVYEVAVRVPAGVLIPDLCVMARGASHPRNLLSPSDIALVVEIESPSTGRRDRVVKAAAYAEAGIPLYWRVEWDAEGLPVVVVNELAGEHYVEKQRLLPGQVGRIEDPFPVAFDPADLVS